MHRNMVAAAAFAAFIAAPLAAQDQPVPAPDPATDVVPGDIVPSGALPPAALPEGDPVPALPSDAVPPPAPNTAPAFPAPAVPAPAVPAPADPAPTVAQTEFTDLEVTSFARAVIAIDPIQADTALDETQRQQKMADALAGAGIEIDTFNAIVVQSRTDAALKTRVQTQIAAIQAAQPPAPGA
jgi:hypothetical protein